MHMLLVSFWFMKVSWHLVGTLYSRFVYKLKPVCGSCGWKIKSVVTSVLHKTSTWFAWINYNSLFLFLLSWLRLGLANYLRLVGKFQNKKFWLIKMKVMMITQTLLFFFSCLYYTELAVNFMPWSEPFLRIFKFKQFFKDYSTRWR